MSPSMNPPLPGPMRALARIIREPSAPDALADAPVTFLEGEDLDPADAAAMCPAGARGPRVVLVYRALVHNRIRNVIGEWIPGTLRRLGPARVASEVAAFLAGPGPRSPYLRDVPGEFVAWAAPRWGDDTTLPPWLAELARFELLRNDLVNDPAPPAEDTGHKLELHWPVRCAPTATLMTLEHAVHRIAWSRVDRAAADGEAADAAPGPVHVVAFRSPRDRAVYKVLTPREAELVAALLAGRPLADAIFAACAAHGVEVNDALLADTAVLLARLAELGLLLGGIPTGDDPARG